MLSLRPSNPTATEPELTMVLGLPFHRLTLEAALGECARAMNDPRPEYFVTPNLDFARLAAEQPRLHDIVFHADRILCDGMPLVWLSRLSPVALPERVAGSDLTPRLLKFCEERNKRVFFFGSDEATFARTAAQFPNLEICGRTSPPFAPIDDWDNANYVRRIRRAQPDLLLVALGCPKQEYWAAPRLTELGVPLTLCIGASLDFIAGTQTRAPRAIQAIGLEWFWRMMSNPKRLAARYARDLVFLLRAAPTQWKLSSTKTSGSLHVQRNAAGESVIDCNDVSAADLSTLISLAAVARKQRMDGGPLPTLQNVSRAMGDALRRFSLTNQFEDCERESTKISFSKTSGVPIAEEPLAA